MHHKLFLSQNQSMYSPESQENIFVKHESLSPNGHSNASVDSPVNQEELKDGISNMDSKRYSLKWRHHQSTVVAEVESLFQEGALCDVTLACEDQRMFQAHKLVLSACSQYFQLIFSKHPAHQHPIIFLKDVNGDECDAILTFMYKGEVSVYREQIPEIIKVATSLQVRGLAEVEPHSSRPTSPLNTIDRDIQSHSPNSPATLCPKSSTPVSEPASPILQSQIPLSQEHVNCSHPQQPSVSSQSLARPALSQDFTNAVGYLMHRPPFDMSPGGSSGTLQIPPLDHERKRSEEKTQMPVYSSPQLRVKSDLGGNWDTNVEMASLTSHPIRDGPRHPYMRHPLFPTFMNLEPTVSATSPGYAPPFSIRDPLNRLTTSGNETRTHKCDFCSRKFKRKDHLKTHVRIHTGERPYKCKICGRGFIQSQQVKIHMKVHSRDDTSSLSASSVLGGNGSGGGLSAHSSLYSELSSHYCSQQNIESIIRSCGSHSNQNCEQSSDQLLGPPTDGDSDNDLSSDIPESEIRCRIPDSKNIDPGSSLIFSHHQSLLKNQDRSPSPERSPSSDIARINDNRLSPTALIARPHINSSPPEENNCLKDSSPRVSYPLMSNIKK